MQLPFHKMQGLGNDFVILDGRERAVKLSPQKIKRIADRHFGIGCDQVIILRKPQDTQAIAKIDFFNQDGSPAETCGNGLRAVAKLLAPESPHDRFYLESGTGALREVKSEGDTIRVDMGQACSEHNSLVTADIIDTLSLSLDVPEDFPPLPPPAVVNIGNPHLVFFIENLEALDIGALGPYFEHHPLFPARINVGFAQLQEPNKLLLKVWERGAGLTLACGSGACAVAVLAIKKGICSNSLVTVVQEGGSLEITVEATGKIWMQGPADYVFKGMITLDD